MSGQKILITILTFSLLISITFAQDPRPANDDVVRITTELVQTGVVVVDKQGRFVEGLKPEEFVLKVDGRQVTPSFFERVISGTRREEKVETAVAATPATPSDVSYRGRTIIFFIDDLHLSADSVQRTKKAILEFVDNEMSLDDQVAIASPSGQIGFLQRFSDLKPVVRAAVNRLNHRPYTVRDVEQIGMTEYQAMRIEQGDQSAADYFVAELLKQSNFKVPGGIGPPNGGPAAARTQNENSRTSGMTPESAKRVVKDRANMLMRQSESVTSGTLISLESLMRSVSQMSGRKLVFLISDGFFLNDRNTGYSNKISRIADAAVRGNLVIYSVDARGLVGLTDSSSNRADPNGQLSRTNVGELAASQDGLNALAVDTGGKAFFNRAALNDVIKDALQETANYYLLAWRPSGEDQKSPNFKRIEVTIPGRPDLTVRLPRGFFSSEPKPEEKTAETNNTATETIDTAKNVTGALMSALAAPSARTGLPTKLFVSFVDMPGSGPVLTAATQMATEGLGYGNDGKQPAAIDLAGIVLNDQGKQAGSFKTRLNVSPLSQTTTTTREPSVVYSHKLPLKPGIYQIRVAARDDKSGSVGSAAQWIEIPDLSAKKLTLSTLLLGGQFANSAQEQKGEQVSFSVDRRFSRESQLTFLTVIYNAVAASAPKLEAQIEILRNGQRVVGSPVLPVPVDASSDLARIPYGAGVGLKTLAPGRYVLRVTIKDRNANTSATNQIVFDVE